MNKQLTSVFWGLILIVGGIYALAQSLGYVNEQRPWIWILIFAGISVIALVCYLVSGVRNWGWLFPVGIFAALAFLLGTATSGLDSPAMVTPLFLAIGLPFGVAYFGDRPRRGWALIPAGIMLFMAVLMLVVDRVRGEYIGTLFMCGIAAAFLGVYLNQRSRWWAALVAYVMFVLGIMPLMALAPRPELSGIVFLFGVGLPFLFIYFRSPERWWAIIPAGILLTLGVVTAILLVPGLPGPGYNAQIPNAVTLAGVAITFAVVGLRHQKKWAKAVAVVVALLAVGVFFSREIMQVYWPLVIIAGGGYLLYSAVRSRSA